MGLRRGFRLALAAGVLGTAACVLGSFGGRRELLQSLLPALVFWMGIGLGSAMILMIHNLTGGSWGVAVRRSLEAACQTVPLGVLLALPVLLGARELYPWAQTEVGDAVERKRAYLNLPFFAVRSVAYAVVWSAFAWVVGAWSARRDAGFEETLDRRLRVASGVGLIAYGLTISFAAVDYLMSLDPAWFSSIYGPLVGEGALVTAMAFAIATLPALRRCEPWGSSIEGRRLQDLGNLLLVFLLLWAYLNFAQYLIVWSGNLPEEATWYLARSRGGWEWVTGTLAIFHFALPFLLLLSVALKRSLSRLAVLAAGVLLMRYLDALWHARPAFGSLRFYWQDAAAMVAFGGMWSATWLWRLGRVAAPPRAAQGAHHGA